MARAPHLRVVDEHTGKRWQGEDDVFMHRRQLRVGVRLLCVGRIDHGVVWTIRAIRTYPKNRRVRGELVDVAVHLTDVLLLVNAKREERRASVQAVSYSAIWRLA